MRRFRVPVAVFLCLCSSLCAQEGATPVAELTVKKGFQVELLYSVPRKEQGSWVNMCVDPKGRLIVSDQYGKLYRVTVPAPGKRGAMKIEPIDIKIGHAQGLLYAFNSLFVMVANNQFSGPGLYRVKDTDNDDTFDEVKLLRKLSTGGEHGPHAILLSPDKKSLTIVCGNKVPMTKIDSSRVPRHWDEDIILPRAYGRGFMKGTPAPGGWIAKTDPEGQKWELLASGFRNEFDAAFNAQGDLFTFDADMEWDMNTPWYRPTRVCHVLSGAEFGWRNGSAKWPAYYEDSVPAVVDIGPGSPTGITFGYGAKFPDRYRNALFISDWSYGKLYAVHLHPKGGSYEARFEEFISGAPLPLTDIVVNPRDKAMYFLIGGRRVQSGLYRVTYTGKKFSDSWFNENASAWRNHFRPHRDRQQLEKLHKPFQGDQAKAAIETAWKHLGSSDRTVRFSARIAIEHQPVETWKERALNEKNSQAGLVALMALCRCSKGKSDLLGPVMEQIERLAQHELSHDQKTLLLRVLQLAFTRLGKPNEELAGQVAKRLDAHYPAASKVHNAELTKLMCFLQAPSAAKKGVALLKSAPTQEEQIDYAASLRHLKTGWTAELRDEYFRWFNRATRFRGGASFQKFVDYIRKDALANLSADERKRAQAILAKAPRNPKPTANPDGRQIHRKWKMADLVPKLKESLAGGRNFARGKKMFATAGCFSCHRFQLDGGAFGPDLTGALGRFNSRDLLESIIDPSKEVSDQYSAVRIRTKQGQQVVGRIINLKGDTFRINTNMLDPAAITTVNRKEIARMKKSEVSMMPTGLVDILKEDEIMDLLAYLLSRGNPKHKMFAQGGN